MATVAADPRLAFLSELVPRTMSVAEALEHQRRIKTEMGTTEGPEEDAMMMMEGSASKVASDPPEEDAGIPQGSRSPGTPPPPDE